MGNLCYKWKAYYSVICGISLHLTLGLQYVVGNLIPYYASYVAIQRYGNNPTNNEYDMETDRFTYLYVINAVFNNVSVLASGKIERYIGIRYTTGIGIVLVSGGLIISYWLCVSFWGLLFSLGVVVGIGIGMIYPMPMLVSMQWFPNVCNNAQFIQYI